MPIARAILTASIALAVLTAPALAKNSNSAPRSDEPAAPPPCHSYEMTADGEWKPLPCQEVGAGAQTQHKSSGAAAGDATH
jgi:hypothetical protein